ncbi:MAG: hypothetical protein AB8G18_14725 [Gammaproteobacteria bacterium]
MEQSPYEPPKAEIKDSGSQYPYKRSGWWKVYFFFIVTLSALGYYFVLNDPLAGLIEYFLFILWVVANTGLFGFVFTRPILSPKFWFIILLADIAFSILYYYVANIDLRMGATDSEMLVNNIINWGISVPAYLGLYLYSQPTDRAWRGTSYAESNDR